MTDTILALQRKINSAADLASVVRTMKAMAATNISQYEQALLALEDYYRTIRLGVTACAPYNLQKSLTTQDAQSHYPNNTETHKATSGEGAPLSMPRGVVIIGTDQGLVGQFNDSLISFMQQTLKGVTDTTTYWSVGELMQTHLLAANFPPLISFDLPRSVQFVTSLVTELLLAIEAQQLQAQAQELYIFFNHPLSKTQCSPKMQKLLPLDKQWQAQLSYKHWPTKAIPQLLNGLQKNLKGLMHEYLFVSLYKACTASLASENISRLNAMQRAEKNITELQQSFYRQYHQQRQNAIDSELFDLLGGFETLRD